MMAEKLTEAQRTASREVLRRVMAEPTFKAVAEAMKQENRKREQEIRDMLRHAGSDRDE